MEPKEWRATVQSTPVFYASPACPPLPFAGHLSSFKAFSQHLQPRKPAFLGTLMRPMVLLRPYTFPKGPKASHKSHIGTDTLRQASKRAQTCRQTCTCERGISETRCLNFDRFDALVDILFRTCACSLAACFCLLKLSKTSNFSNFSNFSVFLRLSGFLRVFFLTFHI